MLDLFTVINDDQHRSKRTKNVFFFGSFLNISFPNRIIISGKWASQVDMDLDTYRYHSHQTLPSDCIRIVSLRSVHFEFDSSVCRSRHFSNTAQCHTSISTSNNNNIVQVRGGKEEQRERAKWKNYEYISNHNNTLISFVGVRHYLNLRCDAITSNSKTSSWPWCTCIVQYTTHAQRCWRVLQSRRERKRKIISDGDLMRHMYDEVTIVIAHYVRFVLFQSKYDVCFDSVRWKKLLRKNRFSWYSSRLLNWKCTTNTTNHAPHTNPATTRISFRTKGMLKSCVPVYYHLCNAIEM